MSLNINGRGVAEFLTGAGAGLLAGVTISNTFIRPLGAMPLAVAYAASAAVMVAGLWMYRLAVPGTWAPSHEAAPEGRGRRAAVAALAGVRAWHLLPGSVQGVFCGCPICKGRDEVPS